MLRGGACMRTAALAGELVTGRLPAGPQEAPRHDTSSLVPTCPAQRSALGRSPAANRMRCFLQTDQLPLLQCTVARTVQFIIKHTLWALDQSQIFKLASDRGAINRALLLAFLLTKLAVYGVTVHFWDRYYAQPVSQERHSVGRKQFNWRSRGRWYCRKCCLRPLT